jgi:L-serine dehydratase
MYVLFIKLDQIKMISVFDMFSIGIGPSSSHTVGPMRAAKAFCEQLTEQGLFEQTDEIKVELFGSLGQTGKGHGTGKAVILGLLGYAPESIDSSLVDGLLEQVHNSQQLELNAKRFIEFPAQNSIVFHRRKTLKQHANGMTMHALSNKNVISSQTYFSIGGGFIIREQDFADEKVYYIYRDWDDTIEQGILYLTKFEVVG